MLTDFYRQIDLLNREFGLEIDPDTIQNIYGPDVVERMAEMTEDVTENIRFLVALGFGEDVSDICNRFGILLCQDRADFRHQVKTLIRDLGYDYVNRLAEDMSLWEKLL